jgi:hypothetical protein
MKIIKKFYEKTITNLYLKIAKKELLVEDRQVNVKKGKRRYTLFISKEPNKLETVFNLGRHRTTV